MDKYREYFDKTQREAALKKPAGESGPVITISRQTGCDARQVASLVVEILNRKAGCVRWRWIDKDLIYDVAKELNTATERVENFYKGIELSNMTEMIMAFSGGFVTDMRVKKAIKDVVLSICKNGNVILVGRGGVAIAHEIPDSLHIRLIAPFYWRVENVMKKKSMDIETAEEYVVDTDEKRHNLITTFLERKSINIDHLFDATINRQSFGMDEIADLIVSMYEKKSGRQFSEIKQTKQIF